jgi:heme ABC exporter ATP-binding subunit CcmA
MATAVHLRDAVSVLGRFPALAGITLSAASGEIVLLQGPNGAGKSTVLRVCAGLVPVVSGEARVLDHDLVADPVGVRRSVGYVGHSSGLYDDMTVTDNLRFWLRAAGIRHPDLAAAMAVMEVSPRLADLSVGRLSAGQRRRVQLALVVTRRPAVWLLDEPHAGLDAAGRDLLDAQIRNAAHAHGVCVLIASHELDRATPLADRTITVAGGMATTESASASGGEHVA